MRYDRILFLLILPILTIACTGEQIEPPASPEERVLDFSGTIQILDNHGDTLATLRVAIADTEESRRAGLMNIRSLPNDHAMLFVFERQEPLSFWMANTPLSLDILFADSTGTIVRIHHHTQPYSDHSLGSDEPARYALEATAGYAMEHDIQEGSRMVLVEAN
ncbi:MAG: DUF192 domain-containing protein [Balneolaceae bacterium]